MSTLFKKILPKQGEVAHFNLPVTVLTQKKILSLPLKDLSDEDLFSAYQKGDALAFEYLLARYKKPLYNFLLRFLHNSSRAEEAFQEIFLKLIRSASDYKSEGRFSTWIYTIARNHCIDESRKHSFRNHLSLNQPLYKNEKSDSETDWIHSVPADVVNQEQEVGANQLAKMLESSLEKINSEQREVFLLRESQGLQFSEIAKITGVSVNTVKSRMRYALRSLQDFFISQGVERDVKKGLSHD